MHKILKISMKDMGYNQGTLELEEQCGRQNSKIVLKASSDGTVLYISWNL